MPADHILIAIHDFSAGGTELIAFRLAKAWMAAGRRVTILAGAPDGRLRDEVPDGAEVVILDPPIPRSRFSRLRLGKPMALRARDLRPDAIFLPGNFHFGLARSFKARLPETPIAGKISNPLLSGSAKQVEPGFLAQSGLRWWTRGIDAFGAMSLGLNRDAAIMLDGPMIATIRDPFLDDDIVVRARTGTPGDGDVLRLLAVGRLEPQKDFKTAIAVAEWLSTRRKVSLTIVGDGALRESLARQIAARKLEGVVTLAGFRPSLDEAYDEADLLLVSSIYEGGPAVVVEGLALGLPFAATDCSHLLRELAKDGLLGTLASDGTVEALGEAVLAAASRPFPAAEAIEPAIARNRLDRAARSWLSLLDGLVETTHR